MGMFDDLIPEAPAKSSGAFDDLIPKQRPSAPSGFVRGVRDPIDGGAQLLTHLLPNSVVNAGDRLNNWLADKMGLVAKLPESGVDGLIQQQEQEYQGARKASGEDGVDWSRLAGNVLSPANAAVAAVAPIRAASIAGKVMQGARAGAAGAAMNPVYNGGEDFVTDKAIQLGAGAVGGAVLTPVISKGAEAITRRFIKPDSGELMAQAEPIMREGVNRLRRDGINLDQAQIRNLRDQVMQSLQQGQKIDPAAVFRKADFEALGMQPTLGQITRDGAQFSREKNLRGVAGIGDPLLSRLDQQSQRLQELVTGRSAGAADEATAGQQMMQSLKGVDEGLSSNVSAAYAKATDHLGRAAPMDSAGFSKAANQSIDSEMLNGALPAQARDILNKVTTGEIPFTVNSAVMIDRRLSGMQRDLMSSGSKEGALAVGKVRDALNSASIADNIGEDAKTAFDTARGMAKGRFDLHKAVPALKAAADGDVPAQDFVRRFLINGKAEDVSGLAKVMPEESKQEARRQFGAAIERAAFGQNVAGDKGIAQESLAKFLNQSGMKQKMGAFFSPEEMAQFERISRVAAYTSSFPANNTVNTSNTASAVFNLLSRIPGVPSSIGLLNSAKNAAGNYTAVNSALKANPAQAAADLSPKQIELLSRLLGAGVGGASVAASPSFGN